MNIRTLTRIMIGLLGVLVPGFAATVDFNQQLKPLLETTCFSCHKEGKVEGGLRIDDHALLLKGGENGVVITPGNPEKSSFYKLTTLPKDDDKVMPPKGAVLNKWQQDVLKDWMVAGADRSGEDTPH